MSDLEREERWAEAEFANGGRDAADRKARERQADVERIAEAVIVHGVFHQHTLNEGGWACLTSAYTPAQAFLRAELFIEERDRRRGEAK